MSIWEQLERDFAEQLQRTPKPDEPHPVTDGLNDGEEE